MSQDQKKYCTENGMKLAWILHARLTTGFCCDGGVNVITGSGSNSIRESETSEVSEHMRQQSLAARELSGIATFIATHRPVTQVSFDKCRVGTLVRGLYEDASGAEREMAFVIGGMHEPEVYGKDLPIFYYEAPFAAEFLGKEVGEIVDVRLDNTPIEFEITHIEKPPASDLLMGTQYPIDIANAA